MPITLTPKQESFVIERIGKLGYTSPEQVLDAALQLVEEAEGRRRMGL